MGVKLRRFSSSDRVFVRNASEGVFSGRPETDLVEHTIQEMLAQRIYGLALGYEDINDHEQLLSLIHI